MSSLRGSVFAVLSLVLLCCVPWPCSGAVLAASKKGVTYGSDSSSDAAKCADLRDFNISWYYNWGLAPSCMSGVSSVEYVPMVWSGGSLPLSSPLAAGSDWLLGFNEPNIIGQADMTPAQAAALWPQLEATGRRLVGPAVADCGGAGGDCTASSEGWYAQFLGNCSGCRVDAVAIHLYYCDAQDAVNKLTALYAITQRPVWLTEFACGGAATEATTLQFAQSLLPRLESLSIVQRYSWFIAYCGGCTADTLLYSSLTADQTGTGNLTAVGRCYSAVVSTSQTTVSAVQTVNIDCGNLAPSTDGSGALWLPDQQFAINATTTLMATQSTISPSALQDYYVFQTARAGPAVYTLPVDEYGVYNVSLLFSEPEESSAGQRVFSVLVQGLQLLHNLDVFQAAGGQNIALQLQCEATVNASTGLRITIALEPVIGTPLISGLSISAIPAAPAPASPSPLYLTFGGSPTVDNAGHSWQSGSAYLAGGSAVSVSSPISGTTSDLQFVYQSNDYGAMTASVPVSVPGNWTVMFMWAETYWTEAGQRLFDVYLQQNLVLTSLDIFARAGGKDVAFILNVSCLVSPDLPYVIIQTVNVQDQGLLCGLVLSPPPSDAVVQPQSVVVTADSSASSSSSSTAQFLSMGSGLQAVASTAASSASHSAAAVLTLRVLTLGIGMLLATAVFSQ